MIEPPVDDATFDTIPIRHFGQEVMGTPDPFDAWRSLTLPRLGTMYDTTPLESFALSAKALALGEVGLSYVRASAQRWARTVDHTRQNELDQVVVSVRFAGGVSGEADGQSMKVPSGGIVIHDLARPQVHDSERSHTASLVLPRALATSIVPDAGALHGLVIPPAQAGLLLNFLSDLEHRAETLPVAASARLGAAAVDLLAVAIAQVAPAHRPAPAALATAARAAAERVIATRLGSATLTVANLCRWIGVSRSRLYRLFEADGGVLAYIRARRLEQVAATLADGMERERVSDLAERWGFCDAAYLTRLFRETYGVTPGEYRALRRVGTDANGRVGSGG